jgi:hypothetical protein
MNTAAAKQREYLDTCAEFERLFQDAQQAVIDAEELAARPHPDKRLLLARRRWATACRAEVDRIRDNLRFYRLTWLT